MEDFYGKPFSHLIRICRYLQLIADICKYGLNVKTAFHRLC